MLVHKFLNQFLKDKMEREMSKYRAVEQAYQKIKAQTVRLPVFILELHNHPIDRVYRMLERL